MISSTSITNEVIAYCYKTMLIKAKIQSTINFLEKKGIKSFNEVIFWSNNVSHATGYRILKLSNPYTFKNNLTRKEIKGPKEFITVDQIKEIEEIL